MVREKGVLPGRWRLILAWVLSALLLGTYLWLPEDSGTPDRDSEAQERNEPARVDIVSVSPSQPYSGGLAVIEYTDSDGEQASKVLLGTRELPILSQRLGTVVVRIPDDAAAGRAKFRVNMKVERSKPYDVKIKGRDWRDPFRDFVGGLALLIFGISVFSHGARKGAGKTSARTLHKYGQKSGVVFTLGMLVGGVTQSTLASAALNAGLVASRLVTTPAAAAAFVGALLGAGVVPLWTGLLDPRAGLVVIAIGVLWLGVATDRRTRAMARLALGVGLVALGLHLMRNGIEPLVVDKTLLHLTSGLHANTVGGLLACVAIGAVLTAILQGAAATLFVVVGLLQTVGQLDLHVVLLVLAGSGLGAALGALLTAGSETVGPRLAKLYLLLGAAHTVVTALTARLWLGVATWVVPVSEPLATFGKNTLRPHLSMQLVLAVVCSQLAAALLILPWVNPLNRWLKERQRATSEQDTAPAALSTREALLEIVRLQREGLQRLWELVVKRERTSGRAAEHLFANARRGIESLLTQLVSARAEGSEEVELRQVGFACLQLQRSFEDLLFRAERFTDRQVALAARGNAQADQDEQDARLQEMHELLLAAIDAASAAIQTQERMELSAARAREIRLNALEAKARRAVLGDEDGGIVEQVRLDILELLDAYEGAGNHLYRLAETLGGTRITRRSSQPPAAEAS